eukprot:CAMPEP_0177649272 /NCGR_PEP_ID=MMETSP0447-20121125/11291_1 /TAXON_ID=0 /ORGANISM="Stygamoeba regulata, Strain BSH-02190019" /LENGTH=90 /DNA_ID=CAMNT_0019152005 /DNA_START=70 /DNA_END=342 /DNA_ORIENTATION=-
MDKIAKDIESGAKPELKHVETVDKAAPKIEPGVHIGENPHKKLMDEVTHKPELKHADTVDKSAPLIEKDVHVGESKHGELLKEIVQKASS